MRCFSLASVALLFVLASCAAIAHADVLELTDGRLVEGVVVENDDGFLVRSRYGDAFIPADQVKARHEAKPVDQQIRDYLEGLEPDDVEKRADLARWLKELGRQDEALEMAANVLEMDPENALAHEVLGHIRHQGAWRTPDEAKRAEGLEKHGERWYTAQEWANQGDDARTKALEEERRAEKARLQTEVNRCVRLMLSPNEKLRERGRKRLEAMAAEFENESLAELARNVDAYVQKLDEISAAAASGVGGNVGVTGGGYVLGEFRATVSRLKRPIKDFTTSLASNIGGAPVRIQLPELEVIRVRTTGIIPAVVK